MSLLYKRLSALTILILLAFGANAQLVITTSNNAQQLAQRLVGDGITISNVTYSGSPLAAGFFRNVSGTNINLDSGIVLSSGRVKTDAINSGFDGPATVFSSTSFNTPGDAQLNTLSGNTTNDAAILEFDFVPIGDTIKFQYVFSSEEYPGFNCSSFNDAFAFFVSGPGITGAKNIALIPGTNIPVAINSVNSGVGGTPSQCTSMGPGSPFVQFYVNNLANGFFTHGGHTVVFTAIQAVQPCQTYHLKLAIADAGDTAYDSGVFLKARSLVSTPLSIVNNNPTANGQPFVVEGCSSGSILIARQAKLPTPMTVNLFFGGTATNGVDVNLIPVSVTIPANDSIVYVPVIPIADNVNEGGEILKIYIANGNCGSATNNFADSISIRIREELRATVNAVATSCTNNNGSLTATVTSGGVGAITYSLNGGTFQTSNTFTGLPVGNFVVTVKDSVGCIYNVTTAVAVNNTLTVKSVNDTSICVGGSFIATTTTNGTGVTYSWSPSQGLSSPTAQSPTVTAGMQSWSYVVLATQGPCTARDTVNVNVFQVQPPNAGPDRSIIRNDVIQLQGQAGPGTYSWTPAAGLSPSATVLNPTVTPLQTTTYTLTYTNLQGCVTSDQVTITVLDCIDPMEAFSPNGDGMNDLWMVTNPQCLRQAKVQVFNRYGALVYESRDYRNNWNGTYNGKPVADGTYYYVISYVLINGKTEYEKGNVTILR